MSNPLRLSLLFVLLLICTPAHAQVTEDEYQQMSQKLTQLRAEKAAADAALKEVLIPLVNHLMAQKNYDEAIRLLEKNLKRLGDSDKAIRISLVFCYVHKSRFNEAEKMIDGVITEQEKENERPPKKLAEVLRIKIFVLSSQGKDQDALKVAERIYNLQQ